MDKSGGARNANNKRTQPPTSLCGLEDEFNTPEGKPFRFHPFLLERAFFESLKDFDALIGPSMCGLCDRDISKSVKVRCMTCSKLNGPALVMCLECLRKGQTKPLGTGSGIGGGNTSGVSQFPNHQKNHPYTVYDNLTFPLLMKDWTAKDELQLL